MKKLLVIMMLSVFSILSFAGCQPKEVEKNVKVEDIMNSIKEKIGKDLEEQGVEDAYKDGNLGGYIEQDLTSDEENPFGPSFEVNKEFLSEGFYLGHMMNVNSDAIIVLKANENKNVEDLKKSLEAQKESQLKVWETYLPDQYEKVQNNIIKVNGNYLLYVTYDQPEEIEKIFDEALK